MLSIPLYAKLAGAGAAGLVLAGGAAAPTLTTALSASTSPAVASPQAPAAGAHAGRRVGIVARRVVVRSEASVLHLTVRQLRSDLRGGTSVEQLAAKAGMDKAQFTAALVADLKPRLAKLVAAGRLKQSQADAILDRVQRGWIPFWTLHPRPAGAAPASPSGA